ncbi:MAG: 30S ribosomal protein S18 [Patescibacteria group bacterium]
MFKENTTNREKQCHFCVNNIRDIDYKDIESLKTFLDGHARILKHKKTAVCSLHQRKLGSAIKRARFMALLPFING